MSRPNILYLHSHDTGRYTQPYGHAVATPNLQRLALDGILFRQAFCAAPTCSPSRAALLTGQSAHSSGMLGLAHRGFALKDYRQHLIHTLKPAGYHTALVGIQHVAKNAETIGYDRVLPLTDHSARFVAPAARDFLQAKPKQPFFLSVGFGETHRPFPSPRDPGKASYCLPASPLPDTPRTRLDMAAFRASAADLDTGIGIVLKALEDDDLARNTLVICTTDHGIAFPGMKCNLTDHGIGVQLVVRGPEGFAGGKVCDGLVSQVDLFPTICEILEIEAPTWLEGRSILPLVRGQADEVNDEIFAEVTFHAAYEPQRAVRTRRWKYIRRFDTRQNPVLPNCDDSPSKEVWLECGWQGRNVETELLYDLAFDPNETHNLAQDGRSEPTLEEMRQRLRVWMERSQDPLLQGAVKPPEGSLLNDPNGLSPSETAIAY